MFEDSTTLASKPGPTASKVNGLVSNSKPPALTSDPGTSGPLEAYGQTADDVDIVAGGAPLVDVDCENGGVMEAALDEVGVENGWMFEGA